MARRRKRPGAAGPASDEPAHEEAWCIRRKDGSLLLSTIHMYEDRCWNLLLHSARDKHGNPHTREWLEAKGYECVPVDVDEVVDDGSRSSRHAGSLGDTDSAVRDRSLSCCWVVVCDCAFRREVLVRDRFCKDCKHYWNWSKEFSIDCHAFDGKPHPIFGTQPISGIEVYAARMSLCGFDEPKFWERRDEKADK
jgi:hypothetical protein